MRTPRYQIGELVWHAKTKTRPVYLQCLECMGKKYLTVILGDDSRVTIECECCTRGWMGAQGNHETYEHFEDVEAGNVSGVEIDGATFEYRIPSDGGGSWCVQECDLFPDEESAKARAVEIAAERTARAAGLNCCKHNKDRRWAWHVKYYASEIKRARENIEHYKAALNYALSVAKSEVKQC